MLFHYLLHTYLGGLVSLTLRLADPFFPFNIGGLADKLGSILNKVERFRRTWTISSTLSITNLFDEGRKLIIWTMMTEKASNAKQDDRRMGRTKKLGDLVFTWQDTSAMVVGYHDDILGLPIAWKEEKGERWPMEGGAAAEKVFFIPLLMFSLYLRPLMWRLHV
ncbi:hypothetical protein VNO78_20603 [Psophocarpus tetragonolobus]|uniref:Uncharacterized protein n=1 Tax=Psophocarpus tetragonolobus TaxID=3891 RepID=A0AAN9S9H7_PSOTE